MPSKKKRHGRHGKPKGTAQPAQAAAGSAGPAADGGAQGGEVSPPSPTAAPGAESQAKPPVSTPAGKVSTVKPAEFEKAAAGAAPAASAAVKQEAPGVAASKGSPKPAKAPASPTKGKPVTAATGPPAHAAAQDTRPKEIPKESPKTKPSSPVKVGPAKVAAEAAGTKGKKEELKPKESPKSAPLSQSNVKPVKVEPAAAAGAATKKGKPEEVTPKEMPKTKPPSPTKLGPAKPEAAVTKGKTEDVKHKETPKTKPTSPCKAEPAKPGAEVSKGKPKPGKPEEGPKKPAVDPFDALAGTLPSESLVPTAPVYTGPEVKEHGVTIEEGVLCGEDERTLPPGYRWEDMDKNVPAGVPEVPPPKPMSTDEALDSLSLGFVSTPPPSSEKKKEPKVEDVAAIDVLSAGFSNSAPPPPASQKIAEKEVAATVSSAGPLKSAVPPADKKAKLEKGCELTLKGPMEPTRSPADKKPKTDESMSLEALDALGDLLPEDEPTPEPPKIRPEDIVKENKLKEEEAVRVGEREDSRPPDYRFKEEDLKHLPPPKVEPPVDTTEALDFLAGGFDAPKVAPTVQAPLPPCTKDPKKPSKDAVDAVSRPSGELPTCYAAPAGKMAPPATVSLIKPKAEGEEALDALAGDFVAAPTKAATVQAPMPPPSQPPQKQAPPTAAPGSAPCPAPTASTTAKPAESMSLEALDALGDLLPEDEPTPEPPKIRPEDIVKENKLKEEEAVRVGEREDSRPPDYRFKEEDLKHLPPPKVEPPVDTTEALDFLAGGFDAPKVAPTVQAPLPPCTKDPKKPKAEDVEALDALAGDFVAAPTKAATVQAPMPPPSRPPQKQAPPTAAPGSAPRPAPAAKPAEPSKAAVDAITRPSGELATCYAAPAVQMPPPAMKSPKKAECDFSLGALVDDAVTPTAATTVQADPQLAADTSDALDALSDTLKDIAPAPAPAPVPIRDVVKEKKIVEERIIKAGEKDDTLPPEYRPTEEDLKEMEKMKAKADVRPKKKSIDEEAALSLLSGDFSTPAAPAATAAPAAVTCSVAQTASAAPKTQSTPPAETMPGQKGPVLDALASTLLPDTPEFKPKQSPVGDKPKQSPVGDKPKAKSGKSRSRSKKQAVVDTSAVDELSGQLGSDVVSTSPTKKSAKS